MINIPPSTLFLLGIAVGLFIGACIGYFVACLCRVSGDADDHAERCELRWSLNTAIVNARFGLIQHPDAPPGAWVVDVPFTASMCRALLGAFGEVVT